MSMAGLPLLILLLLAHLLGDFIFPKSDWIDETYKKRLLPKTLFAHAAMQGAFAAVVLSVILVPSWQLLGFAAIIGATHFVINLAKSYAHLGKTIRFVVAQLLQLLVIGLVWLKVSNQWDLLDHAKELVLNEKALLILIAYFVVIWPFSVLIALVCDKWAEEVEGSESLPKAGSRIGQLERFLILTFIFVEQFAAIGFLLAAKSVLRFGNATEPDHRKMNEYILLGTMTSFSITVAFGLLIKMIIAAL